MPDAAWTLAVDPDLPQLVLDPHVLAAIICIGLAAVAALVLFAVNLAEAKR